MPKLRYGIYGGAFDPIHLGHLLLAEACLRQARLDRVVFVPTGVSPHRSGKDSYQAPAEDRFDMIESAIMGCEEFLVSRFEIDRPERSLTVDTLRYFKQSFALIEPELFLIMGADAFNDLPNWYRPEEVCLLATPLVAHRPDCPAPYFEALADFAAPKRIGEIQAAVVTMPQIEISSTQLRSNVAAGESIRFQVPRSVESHITAKGLYKTDV